LVCPKAKAQAQGEPDISKVEIVARVVYSPPPEIVALFRKCLSDAGYAEGAIATILSGIRRVDFGIDPFRGAMLMSICATVEDDDEPTLH
jgi:hypothetical protein